MGPTEHMLVFLSINEHHLNSHPQSLGGCFAVYSEPDPPPFPKGERDECADRHSWETLRIQIVVYQVQE